MMLIVRQHSKCSKLLHQVDIQKAFYMKLSGDRSLPFPWSKVNQKLTFLRSYQDLAKPLYANSRQLCRKSFLPTRNLKDVPNMNSFESVLTAILLCFKNEWHLELFLIWFHHTRCLLLLKTNTVVLSFEKSGLATRRKKRNKGKK